MKEAVHRFTVGGSRVVGFRVNPDGSVADFEGHIQRFFTDLNRATNAARRKYNDNSISITEVIPEKQRYEVPLDELLKISKPI